ncbi:hypothetical protein EBA30_10570 [Streptococcus mutans]|nr:hypothetical protein EBA30_10570 [Streptococcus mutans]
MIVNFYEPIQGLIRLNGYDLKDIDKTVLRQHINYLPNKLMSLVVPLWII